MKKYIITLFITAAGLRAGAQEFNQRIAAARASYASGKLEDSRFAMEQALQELDIISGKEVLKLLPAKLETLGSNAANDHVSGASGFAGAVIHRDYGTAGKIASVEIISNSPLIASVNTLLSMPFIGRSADGNQKVVKLAGYKGLLQKSQGADPGKASYDLQVPFGSNLLTFRLDNTSEDEVLKLAAAIPVDQIAKIL